MARFRGAQIEIAVIKFRLETDSSSDEPSRVVPALDGEILEYEDKIDDLVRVGEIKCFLVLKDRALNEDVSLFEAMDAISTEVFMCYEALIDPKTDDWNSAVEALYGDVLIHSNILFIDHLELAPAYRGKGIGAKVVRETIATFASRCALVTCQPFPLQHKGWKETKHKNTREARAFEKERLRDFAKVRKFWSDSGFRPVAGSDFFAYSPALKPPSHK